MHGITECEGDPSDLGQAAGLQMRQGVENLGDAVL